LSNCQEDLCLQLGLFKCRSPLSPSLFNKKHTLAPHSARLLACAAR
jgi:hypothetical protein